MAPPLRVIGYVRCSSQEQVNEGMSLAAQRGRIAAWCEATGAELAAVIEDGGVSGGIALSERPGGSEVARLLDARTTEVDAIVIVRLDRLSRDAAEALVLLRRFAKGSLGLVSIADRLDLSTPQGRAMAGVAAVFSQLERELIAQRTADALAELRATGRIYGPIPYGYRAVQDRLEPDPREQVVLARMRRLRARGTSYSGIAMRLNSAGIQAKRGGSWHAMAARSVLHTSAALDEPIG